MAPRIVRFISVLMLVGGTAVAQQTQRQYLSGVDAASSVGPSSQLTNASGTYKGTLYFRFE